MSNAATSGSDGNALWRDVSIKNKHGMHARPAAMFIKTASQFKSEINIEKEGTKVSGRSIMGLLTLELYHGSTVRIHADGPDAKEALDAIEQLIERKFDED